MVWEKKKVLPDILNILYTCSLEHGMCPAKSAHFISLS